MAKIMYIVVLTATLAVLASARLEKYCNLQSCDIPDEVPAVKPRDHVACLFGKNDVSSVCGRVVSQGVNRAEIDEIVNVHNELRRKVARGLESRGRPGPQPPAANMNDLQWSPELADIAQLWANQCNYREHDKCRNIENMSVGQNMAWSAVIGKPENTLTHSITSWYDEVAKFNSNDVKSFGSIASGHYTQLVWGETTHIGCGLIRYVTNGGWNNKFLVCNYGPAGNMRGEAVYQIRNGNSVGAGNQIGNQNRAQIPRRHGC